MTLTISIHAPAKGATITSWHHTHIVAVRFQSTLPRRERLQTAAARCLAKRISIHAPAKGATLTAVAGSCCTQNFNPRSREGSDIIRLGLDVDKTISIHAPAKGATDYLCSKMEALWISIHAPAKGATDIGAENDADTDFNPRSREGSDHISKADLSLLLHFNPRSREGSDSVDPALDVDTVISIHAPAKGATVDILCFFEVITIFQSTLPRRERRAA